MNQRPRPGSPEWRRQFDRDREQFDRMWRWVFPLAVILAVLGAVAALALYAGAAAWLWQHV